MCLLHKLAKKTLPIIVDQVTGHSFRYAGKIGLSEKAVHQFPIERAVPKDNFYRRLKAALDLGFLYILTGNNAWISVNPGKTRKLNYQLGDTRLFWTSSGSYLNRPSIKSL